MLGGALGLNAGASATLIGNNNISSAGLGSASVAMFGSNNSFYSNVVGNSVIVGGTGDVVAMNGGSLSVNAGGGVAIAGNQNKVSAQAGASSTIAVSGTSDTVARTVDDVVGMSGSNDTLYAGHTASITTVTTASNPAFVSYSGGVAGTTALNQAGVAENGQTVQVALNGAVVSDSTGMQVAQCVGTLLGMAAVLTATDVVAPIAAPWVLQIMMASIGVSTGAVEKAGAERR